jgi:hypothetical protein
LPFPLTIVHKLSREISDHNPIILDTIEGSIPSNRELRFDKRWLKEEDFLARVPKIWSLLFIVKYSLEVIQIKLKRVKNDLKGWGANFRGKDKNES